MKLHYLLLFFIVLTPVFAGKMSWESSDLKKAPKTYAAPEYDKPGVKAMFFQGPDYKGKENRVFAYYGLPAGCSASKKVPAMVLVHGGGGTAFDWWVHMWNKRGYAAMTFDTDGCIPTGKYKKGKQHQHAGPHGWGGFSAYQINNLKNSWCYHAPSYAILAHSFLANLPEVDAERIGITGISWGGYLTCMAASNDPRFKVAIPVYGCGYLYDSPRYENCLKNLKPADREKWKTSCDPSQYLAKAEMPILWVSGTNDFAFGMNSLQQSYKLPKGERRLAVRHKMPHGHEVGSNVNEIFAFADTHLKNKAQKMVTITKQGRNNNNAWVEFSKQNMPVKAVLWYTENDNPAWKERNWQKQNASINPTAGKATASLPKGTTAYFFNLYSKNQLLTSSEHISLDK